MKKIFLLAILAASMFSCFNTRVYLGSVKPQDSVVKVNSQWNSQFLYGLVPAKNAKMVATDYIGNAPNYVVRTHTSFVNGLVSAVTFGIYTPTQTTYYLPVSELKK